MTIDVAIRLLSYISEVEVVPLHKDEREAARLGIEALNLVKELREGDYIKGIYKLPGETEE